MNGIDIAITVAGLAAIGVIWTFHSWARWDEARREQRLWRIAGETKSARLRAYGGETKSARPGAWQPTTEEDWLEVEYFGGNERHDSLTTIGG